MLKFTDSVKADGLKWDQYFYFHILLVKDYTMDVYLENTVPGLCGNNFFQLSCLLWLTSVSVSKQIASVKTLRHEVIFSDMITSPIKITDLC